MANNDIVTVICYGKEEQLPRDKAIEKYLECFYASEGSEQERYAKILNELQGSKVICTDGDCVSESEEQNDDSINNEIKYNFEEAYKDWGYDLVDNLPSFIDTFIDVAFYSDDSFIYDTINWRPYINVIPELKPYLDKYDTVDDWEIEEGDILPIRNLVADYTRKYLENEYKLEESKDEKKIYNSGILKNIQLEDEIDEWKVYSADIDDVLGKDIIATFSDYEDDDGNIITSIRIDYNTKTDTYIVNYVDNNGRFHKINYILTPDEFKQLNGLKLNEAKFKDKVKAIKKSLKKNDKRLSDETAQKSAERIAGSMIKNESYTNQDELEELANDIIDFMGADMGTWFDEIQENEEEVFYETLALLESGDKDQIQILIDNVTEADIDEDTANEVGIKTSRNLVNRIKRLTSKKKEKTKEIKSEGWNPDKDLYVKLMREIQNNLGIDRYEIQKEADAIKFRYNGNVYFAEPRSTCQVDIFDDNHKQIGYGVVTDKIKQEVFTKYNNDDYLYELVGGEYAGTYTREEAEKLPIKEPELTADLDDVRADGGFVHRKELDNQLQFKGYLGPMWNGTKDGKAVIRYETQEVYDMLSESEKLNESKEEDYWDAKELARDGFVALLKFNFGIDFNGNNYIITKDAYDKKRFYAKSDEDAIKFYKKWLNAERNAFGDYVLTESENEVVDRPEDLIDKEISEDVIDNEEDINDEDISSDVILNSLEERVGQQLEVGRFNMILQGLFGMYNKTFILPSDLYNMDLDDTQELIINDDGEEYTISYDIIDIDTGIIEIVGVDLL